MKTSTKAVLKRLGVALPLLLVATGCSRAPVRFEQYYKDYSYYHPEPYSDAELCVSSGVGCRR